MKKHYCVAFDFICATLYSIHNILEDNMSTSTFSVRVDSALKTEVEKCLSDMGMNMSTAINIYLRQIARIKAIPFIVTSSPILNQKTLEAMAAALQLANDPK